MKKYLDCPEGYDVLKEHPLYIELFKIAPPSRGSGGGFTLIIPAQFWPRFVIDEEWRLFTFGKFSKRTFTDKYPEKDVLIGGRKIKTDQSCNKTGVIPEDELFAVTKFPNCPVGFSKISENDEFVKTSCYYTDGSDGAYLTIPAVLWDKFTSDDKWNEKMVTKYGRLRELDWASPERMISFSEKEKNKTGVIPEDEL